LVPTASHVPAWRGSTPNETRGQQEWLQAEGVRFSNGAAEPGRHLDVEALAALVEQE